MIVEKNRANGNAIVVEYHADGSPAFALSGVVRTANPVQHTKQANNFDLRFPATTAKRRPDLRPDLNGWMVSKLRVTWNTGITEVRHGPWVKGDRFIEQIDAALGKLGIYRHGNDSSMVA